MAMNAAPLDSPRLQRVLAVLRDGAEHSTRDLVARAHVCAVNSIVAELRANGIAVACRQGAGEDGARVWLYRLAARQPPSGDERGAGPAAGSGGHPLPPRPAPAPGSLLAAAGGPGEED